MSHPVSPISPKSILCFRFVFSEKTKEAADRFGGVVEGHKAEHAALMQSKRDGEAEHENKLSQIELRHREQAIFLIRRHMPFSPYVAPRFPHMSEMDALFSSFSSSRRSRRDTNRSS